MSLPKGAMREEVHFLNRRAFGLLARSLALSRSLSAALRSSCFYAPHVGATPCLSARRIQHRFRRDPATRIRADQRRIDAGLRLD